MNFAPGKVQATHGSSLANVPTAIVQLAQKLTLRHGDVMIAREASGYHLYFASPQCLEQYGITELSKKHLSLNADKHLGLDRYRRAIGTYNADNVALCMKTRRKYRVSELLRMPPLAQRGIATKAAAKIVVNDTSSSLVQDARGNWVPAAPGDTVPLLSLPPEHPAIQYLVNRGYDVASLVNQFGCEFCTRELPEDGDKGRWYRRQPGGFRDTPQNRIIFYIDMQGVRRGWQARYIEHTAEDGTVFVLHPYTNQWVPVGRKVKGQKKPQPFPGYEELDLQKYKTAFGARRNEVVMGFDAAVRWNQQHRPGKPPVGILTEGPLDAGRFGPPGMPALGKSLSENQAQLLANYFRRIVLVRQNDKDSQMFAEKARAMLLPYIPEFHVVAPPEGAKDVGELTTPAALTLVGHFLYT